MCEARLQRTKYKYIREAFSACDATYRHQVVLAVASLW